MNEGDTPNDVDAEKPVFFSSEDSAKSASGHSLFASGNSLNQPQPPVNVAADASISPIKPAAPADEDNSLAAIAPKRRAPSTPDFFSNAMAAQAAPVPKPKRSPLLIIGIVATVLLIGGIVAAAFLLPGGKTQTAGTEIDASAETRESFARFANYALFGEEKTDALPEYDIMVEYMFPKVFFDPGFSGAKSFLDKSNSLFDSFLENYKAESAQSETVNTFINNYQTARYSYGQSRMTDEAIIKSFVDAGSATTNALIDDFYEASSSSKSPLVVSYADSSKNFVKILEVASQLGCVNGYEYDYNCPDIANSEELNNLNNTQTAINDYIEERTDSAIEAVVDDVWKVVEAIGAPR